MKTSVKKWMIFGISAVLLTIVDQFSKLIALKNLKGNSDISILGDVLTLHYLQNTGAAWGAFAGKQIILILFSVIILGVMLYLYTKIPSERQYLLLKVSFVLILCGAIGNLIDRIFRNYVIDFIYIKVINFPVFNIADCYVTIGAVVLIISLFTKYRNNEFSFWFHSKGNEENNQMN